MCHSLHVDGPRYNVHCKSGRRKDEECSGCLGDFPWLGSELSASFRALTTLHGFSNLVWVKGRASNPKCYLSSKVLFRNKWRRRGGVFTNQDSAQNGSYNAGNGRRAKEPIFGCWHKMKNN